MRKISKKRVAIALVLLSALATMPVLTSCGSKPSHATQVDEQPHIFPDYAGTTIPAGIAPLDFNVVGDSMQSVFVTVRGSKEGEIEAHGDYADFDVDDWHKLTEANKGGQLTFTVYTRQGGEWKQYRDFTVDVSNDPLGEWGLTYRLIPPGYEVYGKMGIYQRDLSNFEETAILENTAVPGACLNCHTSNQTSPDRFTFHIRGDHGGTLISEQGQVEMLKAKNDSLKSSMVYPYWHPSGQWIAYSTNNTHQSFHAVRGERFVCPLKPGTLMDMIYMPDALKATMMLMEANPDKLIHRNSFNIASMSFGPETIFEEIRKHKPTFEMVYEVDPLKQGIADSWPDRMDDSCAREEWGWTPDYDLSAMTTDMLDKLAIKLGR